MAQFTLNWDNTDILANANNINQRASYRQKSVGGAWITAGFTPGNPLSTAVTSVTSPVLDSNVIYEFMIESLCTQNGPTSNDNGIIEQIGFNCIEPIIENTNTQSQAVVDLTDTDITKVVFTLRLASNNSVVFGPLTVNRAGTSAIATATGLTANTSYYWQIALITVVGGAEVSSSAPVYLGNVCGPYNTLTENNPVQDLQWIALTQACEKDNLFGIEKVITGLADPNSVWYDEPNNRVYVADLGDPNGNAYWFDPSTAVDQSDMTYSAAITSVFTNCIIDAENRRMYFIGDNSNGLVVYDIDSDTISTVAFGTNGAFNRTLLRVYDNNIYCNDSSTSIIIIDRTTLTVTSTIAIAGIPTPIHFNSGPFDIVKIGSELFVSSNNASAANIGVYNLTLTALIADIVLPGAATWTFGKYWQSMFYDQTSDLLFIGDTGSSKQFTINPTTHAVVSQRTYTNREGKSNAQASWLINPINNDLFMIYSGANNSSDPSPIKRTFIEDRTNFALFKDMFENEYYRTLSHIFGTSKIMGTDTLVPVFAGSPGSDTDGTITILNTTLTGGNTGIRTTTVLQEVDANNGNTPTGETKPNVPDDPDYIAPVLNTVACPPAYGLTCSTDLVTTFSGGTLEYEFSIINSVRLNPAIAKIEIYAYNTNTASVEGSPVVVNSPFNANYYKGTFTLLPGLNYTIQIRYLDSGDVPLQTC